MLGREVFVVLGVIEVAFGRFKADPAAFQDVFVVLGVVKVVFGQLEADLAALEGRRPTVPNIHLTPKVVLVMQKVKGHGLSL